MPRTADEALSQLERLLSRDPMLSDLLAGEAPGPRKAGPFKPEVDILERPGLYRVVLDVPGVPREHLDVELDGSRLVVRGRRPGPPRGARIRSTERGHGAFERIFLLPAQARGDQVEAHLSHGVLTITVPVGEHGRPRKVPIEE